MTSRSSFFKLMKEDARLRIWTFALAMVVFFFTLPVAGAVLIGNSFAVGDPGGQFASPVDSYLGNRIFMLITVTGALICGLHGFSWLFSRKKVDFYHAIPVRREVLFAVSYVNGILIYLIPLVLNLGAYLLITAGHSADASAQLVRAVRLFGMHSLFYLLIYTTAVLAVMVTGKLGASIVVLGTVLVYGPLADFLLTLYRSAFFHNYWDRSTDAPSGILMRASPLGAYVGVMQNQYEYDALENGGGFLWKPALAVFLICLALILLALFLYRIRPSEAAEHSMAFPKSKPVFYFLITVPAALLGALIFQTVADENLGWFVFGGVCFWVLSHCLAQIFLEQEFTAMFRGRLRFLLSGIVSAAIAVLFVFDLTGYDHYLPKESQFESAAVVIERLDSNLVYYKSGEDVFQTGLDQAMETMQFTDYELLSSFLAQTSQAEGYEQRAKELTLTNPEDPYAGSSTEAYTSLVYVKYRLKGGQVRYRRYDLLTEDLSIVDQVHSSNEYKEGIYQILTVPEEEVRGVSLSNGLENFTLDSDPEKLLSLVRAIRKEYETLTLDDMKQTPYGNLYYALGDAQSRNSCMIYPSMTETIALIESMGGRSVEAATLRIEVSDAALIDEIQTWGDTWEEEETVSYEDSGQIAELTASLMRPYYIDANPLLYETDPWLEAVCYAKSTEGDSETNAHFLFRKGEVPDFVKEDLHYDEALSLYEGSSKNRIEGM